MSYKVITALTAAATLAFSAPALANSPSPADEIIQTTTPNQTEAPVANEPVIQIGTGVDGDDNSFYRESPSIVQSRVLGVVSAKEGQPPAYVEPYTPESERVYELDQTFDSGSSTIDSNLDGFNVDNSQFQVDDARTFIVFGAKR